MNTGHRLAAPARNAYRYPLLIRHLLQSAIDGRTTGTTGLPKRVAFSHRQHRLAVMAAFAN